jgi:hypothetical protein
MDLFSRLEKFGFARVFESDSLVLYLKTESEAVKLAVYFDTESPNTEYFPETSRLLTDNVPQYRTARCRNERNLPFYREVEQTELGHLLEHILLEYLCMNKRQAGMSQALFTGKTTWNWQLDPRGTFYIDIAIKPEDHAYLSEALTQSLDLIGKILENTKTGSPLDELPARELRAEN